MHKNIRKGLGHDGEYSASFQPANVISTLTWGFAPGYSISGLQPGTLHIVSNLANDKAASEAGTVLRLDQDNMPIPHIQSAEPVLSGPKARAILPWGNAPGHNGLTIHGLKARAKCLIRNFGIAAAGLLLICAVPSIAQPSHQLRIRIINAKTNQPVHDERLNVALRAEQIGSVAMATDKNGIILVDTGNATTIRILSNMYADCRPRAELYTDYSIDTIRHSGITTGNLCGGAQHHARPGELLLYEIPKTYIPSFGEPPASGLPHSDENPHAPPKPQ